MKQKDLQRSVMSYLESMNILCFPTKPGMALASKHTGKSPDTSALGMADLLAFYQSERMGIIPVWLEVQPHRGKQTLEQKHFQELVQSKRHVYMVVSSVHAVKEFFT